MDKREQAVWEMMTAIRAWFDAAEDKRPSAAALGNRIADIASTFEGGKSKRT